MKMGTLTDVPGLYETQDGFNLQVKVKIGSVTKWKRRSLPGATRCEALIVLGQLREEARAEAERKIRGEEERTVTVYARRWIKSLAEKVERGVIVYSTADEHRRKLETFYLPFFGHMTVDDLRPTMLSDWFNYLHELRKPAQRPGRNGKLYDQEPEPYSYGTLKSAWGTAKQFLGFVTDDADLPKNPVGHVRLALPAQPPALKDDLDASEVRAMTANWAAGAELTEDEEQTLAMFLVGLSGAMRFSELSGLHWTDIDLVEGAARIERSNSRNRRGPPKTAGSRRLVGLSPEGVALLKRLKDRATGEIVFPNSRGGYAWVSTFNDALKAAADRAGVKKHVTSHVLRVTTNNLVRRVADEIAAQSITGHTTREMTQRYSRVHLAERHEVLAKAFGSTGSTGATDENAEA